MILLWCGVNNGTITGRGSGSCLEFAISMPHQSRDDIPIPMIFDDIPSASTTPCDHTTPHMIYSLSFPSLSQFFTSFTPRLSLIITLVIIIATQYTRSPWRKVPPGPKGLPILGNALQLSDKRWMFQKECKQNYGTANIRFR